MFIGRTSISPVSKHYSIYGLSVGSEIDLDAPTTPETAPDVTVRLGSVPMNLDNGVQYNALSEVAGSRLLLSAPRVARYLVEGDAEVTVSPDPSCDARSLAVLSAGAPIAAILHRRNFVCLGGAGILCPRGAVLFTGEAGIGKSTIAAALSLRGYSPICDDIAALRQTADGWTVWPERASLRLWPDSLRSLGFSEEAFAPVRPGVRRRVFPVNLATWRGAPVAAICSLRTGEAQETGFERLSREQAIGALAADTFLPRMRAAVSSEWEHVLRLARLAADTPCYRAHISSRTPDVRRLADLAESLIGSL